MDIYIFTFDLLPIFDTLLIGSGNDPHDKSAVIINSNTWPIAHVYRIFSKTAWMRLTTGDPFVELPGIRVLVEAVNVQGMFYFVI